MKNNIKSNYDVRNVLGDILYDLISEINILTKSAVIINKRFSYIKGKLSIYNKNYIYYQI